jgi:hypothetical protein
MSPKRTPPAIHSKKADKKGRTKDRRHGTEQWTTWVEKARMEPAGRAVHSKRR